MRTSSYVNLVAGRTRQQLLELHQKSSTEIIVAIDFLPFHAPPEDETARQAVYLDGHVAPGVPAKL